MQTGASVSRRHHSLVQAVAALAKSVGYHATIEPSFPVQITTTTDPVTNQLTYTKYQSHKRGDILLIRGNQALLLDISVTRPTCTTNMTLTQTKDVTTQPGAATSTVEQRKHAHYDEECKTHGWKLIPFVFETYGGLGKEATKFLLDMTELADSPLVFLQHARNILSVALQCGNANIAFTGTTQHLAHKITSLSHVYSSSNDHFPIKARRHHSSSFSVSAHRFASRSVVIAT
jgi:hypothetical protein